MYVWTVSLYKVADFSPARDITTTLICRDVTALP